MAGESFYVPILLGLQLDCLSMNPQSVPRVKNLISRSLLKDCRRFVKRILESSTAKEINELLQEMMLKNFPEEYRLFDPRALSPRILSKRRRVPQRL